MKYLLISLFLLCACNSPAPKPAPQTQAVTVPAGDTTLAVSKGVADSAKAPDAARLIVPGSAVGLTHINEDVAIVVKRLGRPDAGDAAMGKTLSIWYANHDSSGYQTAIFCSRQMGNDETSRVKQIRVTSPWFRTEDNLGAGSTLSFIQAQLPVTLAAAYKEAGRPYRVFDSPKGIAFEINAAGKCVGIIVHAASVPFGGNYLPFHDGMELVPAPPSAKQ